MALTITNECCMQLMARYPDKYFELCITSPPYNLGNTHHTGNKRHSPYNDNLDEEDYQLQQIAFLEELYRVTADNCSVFYNHKNRIRDGFTICPYEWIFKTKWKIKQEIVWINGSQNFDKIRFYPVTERIYWLSKGKETLFNNVKGLKDVEKWQPIQSQDFHKRAFPLNMVKDILQCFPSGLKVIEPYLGSGTLAIACHDYGFDLTACELDTDYYNAAMKRIAIHTAQLKLF